MGIVEDNAAVLKQGFQDQQDKIDAAKAELENKKSLVDAMVQASAQAVADAEAAGEAKGFDQGLAQAGQLGGSDKIYSDAQMNQQIADDQAKQDAAVAAVQAQASQVQADLQAKLDAVTAERDAAKQAQADAEAKLASDEDKLTKVRADVQ